MALSVAARFDDFSEIWFPSDLQSKTAKSVFPGAKIRTVGQPSLKKWGKHQEKNSSTASLSGYRKNLKTILYAGGYGDGYRSAFELFVKSVSGLTQYNIFLSLHPKVDGGLEKQVLKADNNKNIIILPRNLKTNDIAPIADIIVSQNSTVGTQALFMGKASIFLDNPGATADTPFVIEKGLAKRVTSIDEFKLAIQSARNHSVSISEVHRLLGLPANPTKNISTIIKNEFVLVAP